MVQACRSACVLLLVLAVGSACVTDPGEGSYLIRCHEALRVHVVPDSVRLAVGDSLTAAAHFGMQPGCAPPVPDGADQWRWTSTDTAVVAVDSVRALMWARDNGTAYVRAQHVQQPLFADSLLVRVVAP